MAKKLTVDTMKKRLDTLIKAVRFDNTENGVTNKCVTCAHSLIWEIRDLQCGHFIKRGDLVLKYEPTNLMPQCRRCNHFLDGAQDKAALYILDAYGEKELRRLVETDKKWLNGELEPLRRKNYVHYYNFWLERNRYLEKQWGLKLIPKAWELTE